MRRLALAIPLVAAIAVIAWWSFGREPGPANEPPPQAATTPVGPASDSAEPASTDVRSAQPAGDHLRVAGRIVDPLGEPISGCEVLLLPVADALLDPEPASALDRARTGPDGRFEVHGTVASRAVLVLQHPQFPPRTVELAARGTLDLGDVRLASALGCVALVRRAEDGGPVEGASVTLLPELVTAELANEPGRTTVERSARTGADGRALLYGVPPGGYRLRVTATGRASIERPYLQADSGPPHGFEIRLAAGHALSGRVVTPSGAAIADADVTIAPGPDVLGGSARTSTSGEFRLSGLPAGPVRVRVDAKDWSPVEVEAELPLAGPLVIRVTPAAELAGRVVDARTGAPIAGADVVATPADGFALVRGDRFVDASARTDDAGNFRIGGLPPGRFFVTASSERHAPARVGPLSAGPAPDQRPTLELEPAVVVHGRVLGASGRPVAGAEIEVMDPNDDGTEWAELVATAVHGPVPRAPATSAANGTFDVWANVTTQPSIRLRVRATGQATLLTGPIPIPEGVGAFRAGDLRMPAGHILAGVARDGQGRPLAGAAVCAEPVADPTAAPRQSVRTTTDAGGRFRFDALPAGPYDVFYYLPSTGNAASAADRRASTRTRVWLPQDGATALELAPR